MKYENETTDKCTVAVGELVPQPHGGALRNGGTNAGGTGRPASAVRATCRGAFDTLIPIAIQIVENPKSSNSDRIRALDLLAKIGLPAQVETQDGLDLTDEQKREMIKVAIAKLKGSE